MKSNTGGKNLEDAINELDIVKNINKVSPYNYSKETLVSYFPDKEKDINGYFDVQGNILEGKKEATKRVAETVDNIKIIETL